MIFAIFLLFSSNVILRLNDFIPGFQGFPLAEILIPILVVLWLLFERKDFTLTTDLLIPAFFCVVVFGYALMVWPGGSLAIARSFVPWVAMYFLTSNLVRSRSRMDWYLSALLLASFVLVAHSLQQRMNWDGLDDKTGVGWSGVNLYQGRVRYVGVMNDPNDLALYFVMMLPVALMLSGAGMRLWQRCCGYILCAPLLVGIYLTNSRGGLLATGMIAALFTWRRWGWVRSLLFCGVFAALVLAVGPSRIREGSESDQQSSDGRINAWYEGLVMFRHRPVLGIGKDQFVESHEITAHNSFVLCFTETGFVGYVIWLSAGVYALLALYHIRRRTRPGTATHRQSGALFDALCGFFVGGFFLSRTYFILLPIFLGLAMALYRNAREEMEELEYARAHDPIFVEDLPNNDLSADADPLPDFSWQRGIVHLPKLACLALITIIGIYVLVKIKL
jgi:putative inorganic carbon (hco3(-)) transporter